MKNIILYILFYAGTSMASKFEHSTTCPDESNVIQKKTVSGSIPGMPDKLALLKFEKNSDSGSSPTYLWLVIVNKNGSACQAFDIGDASRSKFIKTLQPYMVQLQFRNTILKYDLSRLDETKKAEVEIIKH